MCGIQYMIYIKSKINVQNVQTFDWKLKTEKTKTVIKNQYFGNIKYENLTFLSLVKKKMHWFFFFFFFF